jgi:hypothetical protein
MQTVARLHVPCRCAPAAPLGPRWSLDETHRSASAGCPSPGPSPLVPRGEGRVAARRQVSNCARRSPPLSRPLPPELQGGEEKFDRATTVRLASPFPHAVCGGRAGDGGRPTTSRQPAPTHPEHLRLSPTPTSPSLFWGRWARFTSPEGAPRVAPNSADAHRRHSRTHALLFSSSRSTSPRGGAPPAPPSTARGPAGTRPSVPRRSSP